MLLRFVSLFFAFLTGYLELTPFLMLFFINMQWNAVFEIVLYTLVAFFVIVPIANEHMYWELDAYVAKECAALAATDPDMTDPDVCQTLQEWRYCGFSVMIGLIAIIIILTSYFIDNQCRRSFIDKRLIEEFQRRRERDLSRQKKDREDLLLSIFPKSVAQDLLNRQLLKDSSSSGVDSGSLRDINAQKTVARMHQNVTILFTGECLFLLLPPLFLSPNALLYERHSIF
uniref:Uncharacterized protein n=1 Tax=Chloropicon laureae TaxID=464258 RepID=A0A7S2Z6I7_9CHLO|mmetsp:Transcript_7360/g.18916  ORF Transcript_7360/g.18916 Transcript_7360/m.18916 type:complete len:229 (+) Transcript_7360:96-782(+)